MNEYILLPSWAYSYLLIKFFPTLSSLLYSNKKFYNSLKIESYDPIPCVILFIEGKIVFQIFIFFKKYS